MHVRTYKYGCMSKTNIKLLDLEAYIYVHYPVHCSIWKQVPTTYTDSAPPRVTYIASNYPYPVSAGCTFTPHLRISPGNPHHQNHNSRIENLPIKTQHAPHMPHLRNQCSYTHTYVLPMYTHTIYIHTLPIYRHILYYQYTHMLPTYTHTSYVHTCKEYTWTHLHV